MVKHNGLILEGDSDFVIVHTEMTGDWVMYGEGYLHPAG